MPGARLAAASVDRSICEPWPVPVFAPHGKASRQRRAACQCLFSMPVANFSLGETLRGSLAAGCLVENRQLSGECTLVRGPRFGASDVGGERRILLEQTR